MEEFARGVVCIPTSFVNSYLIGEPGGPWALVDSGLPGFSGKIRRAAEARFGAGSRPEGIFLTHGHFDHSGGARALADAWGAPVFAHRLELPYLSGRSEYPPPDPTVGGCIAQLSRVMPRGAVDLGLRLQELGGRGEVNEGVVPGMDGWSWLHTPGHAPGQVAFFRAADRTLLAGDAFATMNLDSYVGLITKRRTLATGGAPFICDWDATSVSLQRLSRLEPAAIGCGHGYPMTGPGLAEDLKRFAQTFSPPTHGRYVAEPALTDERGVDWLPPRPADPGPAIALVAGAAAVGFIVARRRRSR